MIRRSLAFAPLFVVLVALGGRAQVTSLPVVNSSFELPAIPTGTFLTVAPPAGWSVFGGPIDFNLRTVGVLDPATTSLYSETVPDGDNVAVVFLLDDFAVQTFVANQEAGLEQTLDVPLTSFTRYTLTVEVGNIDNSPFPPNDPFQFTGFPGYRIELLAGGTPVVMDVDSLLPPEGGFLTSTITLVTGSAPVGEGQPLGIRLVNLNAAPGLEVNFDDVRLEAEPAPPTPGQANSAAASLTLDGVGSVGTPGPFLVYVGNTLTMQWTAPPGSPLAVFAGPLNPANASFAGVGILDVGTPPTYADVTVLMDGVGSPAGPGGTSTVISPVPAFLSGIVFDVQGLVVTGAPSFAALTAAFRGVVL